jgi:predicted nucleic acid-binding protein
MSNSCIVIDAGVALLKVLDTPTRPIASALWDRFQADRTSLFAPRLWSYEITSVVHKYLFDAVLTPREAEDVVRVVLQFGVQLVDEDEKLCLDALRWATRLNQRAAYDGFYMALAQQLDAEFWTSDTRLCTNARAAGIDWVHHMGESL